MSFDQKDFNMRDDEKHDQHAKVVMATEKEIFRKDDEVYTRDLQEDEKPVIGIAMQLLLLQERDPQTVRFFVERIPAFDDKEEDDVVVVVRITNFRKIGAELETVTGKRRKWNTIWKGLTRQGFTTRRKQGATGKSDVREYFLGFAKYKENVCGKIGFKRRYKNKNKCIRVSYDSEEGGAFSMKLRSHLLTPVATEEEKMKFSRRREIEEEADQEDSEEECFEYGELYRDEDEDKDEDKDENEKHLPQTRDLREMFGWKSRSSQKKGKSKGRGKGKKRKTPPSDDLREEFRDNELFVSIDGESTIEDQAEAEEQDRRLSDLVNTAAELFKDEFINIVVNVKRRNRHTPSRGASKRVRASVVITDEGEEDIYQRVADDDIEDDDCMTPLQKKQKSVFIPPQESLARGDLFGDGDNKMFQDVFNMENETQFSSLYDMRIPAWFGANSCYPESTFFQTQVF